MHNFPFLLKYEMSDLWHLAMVWLSFPRLVQQAVLKICKLVSVLRLPNVFQDTPWCLLTVSNTRRMVRQCSIITFR